MQCVSCEGQLSSREIKQGLHADVCNQCAGVWLDLNIYQNWVDSTGMIVHESQDPSVVEVAEFSPKALFCLDCNSLLHKYRLSAHAPVRIDRCSPCRKVWLDAAEWQLIEQQAATDDLLSVLSDRGQRHIRSTETRDRISTVYRQRFGEDYEHIVQLRAWLETHPQRQHIMAYFNAPDPYAAPVK